MSTDKKPRLLVIGAGFAGVTLATKVSGFADVTIVDPMPYKLQMVPETAATFARPLVFPNCFFPFTMLYICFSRKEYLEITWATIRSIVDESVASRAIISLKEIPNIGRVVQATVTRLAPKEALLSTGETLTFDYAAICTGSSYSDAFKSSASVTREQRLAELKVYNEAIRAAKSIVVVGGGPSGVEAAAEVVEAYAGKALTLVHSGKQLLPTAPPKGGAKAKKFLESRGIKQHYHNKRTQQDALGKYAFEEGRGCRVALGRYKCHR
ncbi:hypothetical protein VOLCADRAFT_96658 [Volvox carteri f. nagariensis]|uniref:FAD/NAD(P)-binding domain-containing protein n=1 Tax=Volvox carteri f. nagariensis TaxID=3068 RepID=D8UAQ0_VOLCA|nr:uncharacterized protein VOLCADRAFT_96658 [Volvox carteri f. nagariensis]EFJ43193.1 hypothetical protein VOLCADRAFT_96658 [Volvox carteri f. nagariensis]|eukprot:XP_002955768.1 hypothetical protein VOLCADRAFT_96658 [Volvox carteri f. nagariensis]